MFFSVARLGVVDLEVEKNYLPYFLFIFDFQY